MAHYKELKKIKKLSPCIYIATQHEHKLQDVQDELPF